MKITSDTRLILEMEANLRSRQTSYKELAKQTGLSPQYIAQVVARMIRSKRQQVDVTRETIGAEK